MSQFISGGWLPVNVIAANDIRICDQIYFGPRARAPTQEPYSNEMHTRADNGEMLYPFATRWWPRCSAMLGGWSGSSDDTFQNYVPQWIDPRVTRGANGRLGFVGYTKDQYGSPLGGCTVRLYRTSTEEQQCKVVSDANGLYFATTPYNDAHFMVIHNPSGVQGGATRNDLLPS